MTDAEFRAFVAQARAEVDAELARLDTLDWESMAPDERAMEELRRGYIELRDSMADEAIAAELQATPGWTQPAGLLLLAFPLVRDALTLRRGSACVAVCLAVAPADRNVFLRAHLGNRRADPLAILAVAGADGVLAELLGRVADNVLLAVTKLPYGAWFASPC